jgi:hypothetical protein
MIVLSDNDVRGAVAAFRRILQSPEWADFSQALDLRFAELEDVGLASTSSDREIWTRCQEIGAMLVTANRSRADGPESLDRVIEELNGPTCLPVVTIGDQVRPLRDPDYARERAIKLLEYVESLDNIRGAGRIYL